ncbi:septum formation initiator family protein [Cellulomonas hominis]|uniref:septum formation initiator family protein n=1 Tax=Cellulomonas hominis TaxID=156981 RepID=UPI001FE679FB|nr:septum formation initiator family protein [Cellulomonas hominis]
MPPARRPAAPRSGAAPDDPQRPPAPRSAPRTTGVPRSPAPARRTGTPAPATRRSGDPAARPGSPTTAPAREASPRTAAPATRAPAGAQPATRASGDPAPRPGAGVPQQSVPRPAAPRPATSRARATPSAPPRPATSRPGGTRPGGRGSGGRRATGTETVQQRLPRLFTVRALVMLIVLSIAFVLVFPTLRQYLDQQVQLEQLRAEVSRAEARNEDLQAELDRWSDPAYVEAQARSRLAFVMPGERALRVADPEVVPPDAAPEDEAAGPVSGEADDPTRPWYARVWDSVQIAGVAGTGTSEGPAATGDNGTAPEDGTGATEPAGEPSAPTP